MRSLILVVAASFILAMGFLFIVMKLIHKHYATVIRELEARAVEEGDGIFQTLAHPRGETADVVRPAAGESDPVQ